jgi:uncharacterized glyoxalase superfamily protein PhnB
MTDADEMSAELRHARSVSGRGGVPPVPEEFHTVTPHLTVRGCARAIDFYARAFGARELFRNHLPDGATVVHAELLIGDSRLFVSDEFPERGVLSPLALGGSPVALHLYVRDADAAFRRAVEVGAEVLMPLADTFWGERYGILRDPFGHKWSISSRIEDLSPAELQRRAREWHVAQANIHPSSRPTP